MKVVIVGGGIAGLLAAFAMRKHRPTLLEAKPTVGGNYASGGLKYIRRTPLMESLLHDLNLPWKEHKPIGKLYLEGKYFDHPAALAGLNEATRQSVQRTHWWKTRGTPEGFRPDCMNDPLGNGADMALQCDHVELLRRLEIAAKDAGVIIQTDVKIVDIMANKIRFGDGKVQPYAHLIPTIPLGILSRLATWANLPDARPRPLTIVDVIADQLQPTWDYMYTPQLPMISRIVWPSAGRFQLEIPGVKTPGIEPEELNLLLGREAATVLSPFTSRIDVKSTVVIPGHLMPLSEPPKWPSHWYPLGRFTEWEPRATAERVWARALAWTPN